MGRRTGRPWRTLAGVADFAIVRSYLSTATKWGLDSYDVLTELFTTGAWLRWIMHTDYRRPLATFTTTIAAAVRLHIYRAA